MQVATKKTFRIIITIVLLLVVAGIIFYPKLKPLFGQKSDQEQLLSTQRARGVQSLNASGYVLVPTRMHEMIYSTASLLPDEEVDLAFETSGKVIGIYFEEGKKVKKGELLAKINDKPLQAQLLKLQAQKKLVEEREFRQRQLLDRDAISRESYDQVATELQSVEADIMLLEARIAETELRAPFDGIVGLRLISEGAYASTQTRIVRLVKISPLKIEFSVPERYSGEITAGFPIQFSVDGYDDTFYADVYAIEPKVDINTRTISVRALYANRNEELKPGRFASVRAQLSQIDSAISIPSEALIPEMSGEKVFIFKNGQAIERKVSTGLRTESHIQITKGLEFGDTLLTTAILQLREGLAVQLDTLVTNQQLVSEL